MKQVNVYLNFDGNAEEAFLYYQTIFGGKIENLQKFGDTDFAETIPEEYRNRVMHVSLPMSHGNTLMASDIMPSMGHQLRVGNNVYISIEPESRGEADRVFEELAKGGSIEMPLQETFWGAYYGVCVDQFGIQWMINCTEK